MNLIEINGSVNENVLSISLYDLLTTLKNVVEKYYWSIYEITAIGNENSNINIPELETKVFKLPTGLHLTGEELIKFSKALDQVINLILIASKDKSDFSELENIDEWQSKYPLVIEIVDGYCWNVYSQDREIINFLAKIYKNTKIHLKE